MRQLVVCYPGIPNMIKVAGGFDSTLRPLVAGVCGLQPLNRRLAVPTVFGTVGGGKGLPQTAHRFNASRWKISDSNPFHF